MNSHDETNHAGNPIGKEKLTKNEIMSFPKYYHNNKQ